MGLMNTGAKPKSVPRGLPCPRGTIQLGHIQIRISQGMHATLGMDAVQFVVTAGKRVPRGSL
jgi:hypothetical protein